MNRTIVRIFLVVVLGTTIALVPPRAGGEAEAHDEMPAAEKRSDRASREAPTDTIAAMQHELEKIGIRTFRGSIASADFSLPNLGGETRRLSDYRGEVIFLNFWATWCPPCREEMPSMEELSGVMEGTPFRILAVNVQEDEATVAAFVEEYGYTFPILLDRTGQVAGNYSVRGIPTSYFIAPDGTMLGVLVGTRYWDEPEVVDALRKVASLGEG